MSGIEFIAPAGKTFSVQLYNSATNVPLGAAITPVTDTVPTRYRANTGAATDIVFVVATTTNLRVAGYANLDSPAPSGYSPLLDNVNDANLLKIREQMDASNQSTDVIVKQIRDFDGNAYTIASPAGSMYELEANSLEIASDIYTRLAGARSTLLSGPVSAGGPLDQVKTVDLSYTIPITIPTTSELLWFMRCHPDASNAYLIASKTVGLTQLMTNASPTANQASITRNANNVAILIKAAALSQLPSETVACELRERTQAGDEISRHEVEITLRHSAGRN